VNDSPDRTAERIESLKAGTLTALSFTLAYSIAVLGNSWLLTQFEELAAVQITSAVDLLVKVAIAFLSGFLFGVTYRYAIRDDKNPHLKAGVVLAFGLVRGVAPVEVEQNLTDAFWSLAIVGIESVLCFLIARFTLDLAIYHHWVKPLK
jgi:fucose permease